MRSRAATFLRGATRSVLALIVALMLVFGSLVGAAHADTTHVVQPGDTLIGIAARYGVTVEAIVTANKLPSRTIYVGQRLTIPSPASSPTSPPRQQPAPGTYVVQPGDNLITLARRFGVSREALAAANGLSPSDFVYVGQVLKIPGASPTQPPAPTATATPPPPPPSPPPATATATATPLPAAPPSSSEAGKTVQYTVQPGDNLSTIALKFNTTVQSIMELNKLDDGNFLRVGQTLTIVRDNAPSPKTPTPVPTPPMGQYGPKWIDVNLSTQTMIAFEGQTPVFLSKMSSGTYRFPTVLGTYRVYAKYKVTSMRGFQGTPDYYYIPSVPWVMYFYSGYGLHGAPWHNNFGRPMSHGCVNLPVDAAKWVFEWAPIGTLVVSHE